MSIRMIDAVKRLKMTPTQKLVLFCIADCYNDETKICNPSVSHICEISGLCERSVQTALRELIKARTIERSQLPGRTPNYRITPAADAPPQQMRGAAFAADPRSTCTPPPQHLPPTPAADAPKPELTGKEPEGTVPTQLTKPTEPENKQERKSRESKQSIIAENARLAGLEEIPPSLRTDEFCKIWREWCDYRTEMARLDVRKVWTPRAAKMTLAECEQHGAHNAVAAIQFSISRSYQGLVWRDEPPRSSSRSSKSKPNGTHPHDHQRSASSHATALNRPDRYAGPANQPQRSSQDSSAS